MRKQLFINFLKWYLYDVSGLDSTNVHKLVKESKRSYRMKDSLILYCALANKKHLYNKYTNNKNAEVINKLNENNFLSDEFSDYEFKKIYTSYIHKTNVVEYDSITKRKVRDNIVDIMGEKGISNYRVYKDLKLNPGNINDYLKNNNVKKVSRDVVLKIFDYVYNY